MNKMESNHFHGLINKHKEIKMFNPMEIFNKAFTPVKADLCRISFGSGRIAIKCRDGSYKTWNEKEGRLTNVNGFSMNLPTAFFIVPTCKVVPGDIIIDNDKPMCVKEVFTSPKGKVTSIKVINYEENEIREILPVRHALMGSVFFYRKIINLFNGMFGGFSGKGLFGKMMQMGAMCSFFGGSNPMMGIAGNQQNQQMANNPMAGMMQMMGPMYMMQMMGNMFGNSEESCVKFFDSFDLGMEFNNEESEESTEEVEETPKPKNKGGKGKGKK